MRKKAVLLILAVSGFVPGVRAGEEIVFPSAFREKAASQLREWGYLEAPETQSLAKVYAILLAMEDSYRTRVNDYTAEFRKRESWDGSLLPEEVMEVKLRKPFALYMHWIDDANKGREVLFEEGKNDNRMKAHEGGWLGFVTLNLDPRGGTAMKKQHHPVTHMGLGRLIDKIAHFARLAFREKRITKHQLGIEAPPEGKSCWKVEFEVKPGEGQQHLVKAGETLWQVEEKYQSDWYLLVTHNPLVDPDCLPEGQKVKIPDTYGARTVLWVDPLLLLPVQIHLDDEANKPYERFAYRKLKLNVGLTDRDFDPGNSQYGF